MDAQNIYDDPEFLAGYLTLDRQVRGLDGAAEWPTLQSLLPAVADQRIVDLGCGLGWFGRWAHEQGAASTLGVDVSAEMLARAEQATSTPTVTFERADLDQLELDPHSVDLAFSSLTLHYVRDLARLMSVVTNALKPGGTLVFSVEHPIYSAPTDQSFQSTDNGSHIWPLDNYLVEGERVTSWFVDGVVKQHRSVATYVNTVVHAGLRLDEIVEWGPSPEQVAAKPELAIDLHRPWFLLVRASRPDR